MPILTRHFVCFQFNCDTRWTPFRCLMHSEGRGEQESHQPASQQRKGKEFGSHAPTLRSFSSVRVPYSGFPKAIKHLRSMEHVSFCTSSSPPPSFTAAAATAAALASASVATDARYECRVHNKPAVAAAASAAGKHGKYAWGACMTRRMVIRKENL